MILVDNSYIGQKNTPNTQDRKNKTNRCGKNAAHNAKEIIKV